MLSIWIRRVKPKGNGPEIQWLGAVMDGELQEKAVILLKGPEGFKFNGEELILQQAMQDFGYKRNKVQESKLKIHLKVWKKMNIKKQEKESDQ